MLSKKIVDIFNTITVTTGKIVAAHIDKKYLTGKVDFVSIYAKSLQEFEEFSQEIAANGTIADPQPKGSYYWLKEPLQTTIGTIRRCRVRKFDMTHPERGYNDFEVVDFKAFKLRYMNSPYFSLVDNHNGIEMLEFRNPQYDVRVYFPNTRF
ncbi:MAG: hypothetical protein NTZ55_02540 [Candidatus Roizmanbacteria bacterium]|nr:hypothetical protein [Candidatus Roizmanbacteria bacterium]